MKRLSAILCLAFFVSLSSGCLEKRGEEELKDTLIYGFSENFKTFDPARQVYAQETAIIHQVLEPLARWNNELEIEPCLATSWETPDDCRTWIFDLRKDVTFHDGTPFTSEAVKTHFLRILDPKTAATRAHLISDVESIETPDPYTVIFNLSSPNCIFVERLTAAFASIVSPAALEKYGKDIASHPVGTGPFILESWNEATMHLKFRRNPAHWRAEDFLLERVEMRQIRENTTRLILLEQGVLDMCSVSSEHVNVARRNPNIELKSVPYLAIVYIGFNCQKPPFDDPRVRRACNHAVNKEDIIKYMFFGVGEPAKGPLPEVLPAFNDELDYYEYDPDKARQLLEEANYPFDYEAQFWTKEVGSYNKLAQAVVEYLRKVGINAQLRVYDNGVYWDKFDEYMPESGERFPTKEGVYDMYVGGWAGGEAAHGFLEPLFKGRSYSNSSFYDVPGVNRLLDEYKYYPDEEDRERVYKEIQRIIVEDAPWIFAYFSQINTGTRHRVKNFEENPSGRLFFEGVSVDDELKDGAL